MRLPLPPLRIPRVLGVDDFALKRRHRYATILIDAETGERIDVLPGRGAEVLETWLRSHPGVAIVRRDGSGAYGEAVRRALPDAGQAGRPRSSARTCPALRGAGEPAGPSAGLAGMCPGGDTAPATHPYEIRTV